MSELGDLLELLHGARHRYRTLRATVRDWHHRELAELAWERYEEASEGSVARLVAVSGDPEPEPAESEGLTRLWWEPPDRVREERPEGLGRNLHIVDGDRWWAYWPGQGAVSNADDPSVRSSAEAPRPELFDPGCFLGLVDLEPLGPTRQAGRPALRVRARPRPMADSMDRYLPDGADLHELVVDAERGVLLRLASLIDGREYQVAEIVEIAFDEDFPPDTFVFTPPPGEEVASIAPPAMRVLTLHEAAREAPFTVLAPARVPRGLEMLVQLAEPGWPSHQPSVHIGLHGVGAGPSLQIWQSPAGEGPPPGVDRIEREGQELAVAEVGGQGQLWLERDGVQVMITSAGLDLGDLIEVALSLRPAPTEPPRLVDA